MPRTLLNFLLALLLGLGGLSAAQTTPAIPVVTCDNVEQTLKNIRESHNSEAESNPLMIMIPKADCWLARTKATMNQFGISEIIPAIAIPLALAGLVASILSATASGVPRKITEVAIQGIVGGAIIIFSVPTDTNRTPLLPTLVTSSWVQMYQTVGNATGEEAKTKISEAAGDLGELIMDSPLALIGGFGGGSIVARAGVLGERAAVRAAADAAVAAKTESTLIGSLSQKYATNAASYEQRLKAISPQGKTALEAERDRVLGQIDAQLTAAKQEAGAIQAGADTVSSEAAKAKAAQQAKDAAAVSNTTSKSLSMAFLLVVPLLIAYAGAVYMSGIMAIALGLAMPMMGVAVILGNGNILMQLVSRHIANLLVIAILPVAFMISLDIGYVQPLVATKGMFQSMRDSGGEAAKAFMDGATGATFDSTGIGFVDAYTKVTQSINMASALLSSLKYLILALIIGLVMFVGSMGLAAAVLTKMPAIIAKYLEGGFETLGGTDGRFGQAVSTVTKAVFKTKGK